MKKHNCWEFKKCGREPGGSKVGELGECPVASEKRLDRVHGGSNAGRACWVVAGSMCEGHLQGTFAIKYRDCSICDFYQLVKEEESWAFANIGELLQKLNNEVPEEVE